MANVERIVKFEAEMEKLKFDIFGTAEVRKLGEKLQKRVNENRKFFSGQSGRYRGTGFYICKKWVDKESEIKSISERISF